MKESVEASIYRPGWARNILTSQTRAMVAAKTKLMVSIFKTEGLFLFSLHENGLLITWILLAPHVHTHSTWTLSTY